MDTFERTLKQSGFSVTKARSQVFKALQSHEPLSMHQLIERCQNIDRASVYRTVGLLEQLGIIQRVQSGWKYKLELSDTFQSHHHHATCLRCGKSQDVPEDARLEVRLYELADLMNFLLERHQLEFQGYCKDCQKILGLTPSI